MADHADLAQRERDEHSDDVELDERSDVSLVDDHEDDRESGKSEDAIAECKPITSCVELLRQVAVPRQNGSEYRKSVEGRVRCEREDEHRGEGDDDNRKIGVVKDRIRDLDDNRLLLLPGRQSDEIPVELGDADASLERQPGDAAEHRHGDHAEEQQGRCRILRLGRTECRDPVRNRLDTGERGRARGEGPGNDEHQSEAGKAGLGNHIPVGALRLEVVAHRQPNDCDADHDEDRQHEEVDGHRKERAGLLDAPKVEQGDDDDDADRPPGAVQPDERQC